MLQDILSEVFVTHQLGDQAIKPGTVTVDQDFERALIADVRSLDEYIIRQV